MGGQLVLLLDGARLAVSSLKLTALTASTDCSFMYNQHKSRINLRSWPENYIILL